MKNSVILNKYDLLKSKKISYSEIVNNELSLIKNSIKNNDNIILDIYENETISKAKELDNKSINMFDGITFLLKDNVNYKGYITTSGSNVMRNYVSPFDATIIKNIQDKNGIILGKLNLDELGHAGTGTHSAFGIVKNLLDDTKITGGSSSGSAIAVKYKMCDVAIGTDTGDSIRHPASYLGVVGFKPSYGLISRYGITPYASSLDHVGVLCNSVTDVAISIDILKGKDKKDLTSVCNEELFYDNLKIEDKKYNIVVFDDVVENMELEEKNKFKKFISDLEQKYNVIHDNFGKELLEILSPLYNSISFREGWSNWNNVNGILFGSNNIEYKNYQDLMIKTRSQFGAEVKRRYIVSSLFNDLNSFELVYENSNKVRRIIVNKINEILNSCDIVMVPSSSRYAPLVKDALQNKNITNICDDFLMVANFAGLPSITIPLTSENNKNAIGINLTGLKNNDNKVLNITYNIENFIKEKGYYD